MPNSHRRQPEVGSRRSTPPEMNPPHFFKIVHSSTVEKQKLKIPPKFVRKHGENLSNTIFLKVPNGEAEWRVESKKNENGEVWLDRGWQDFADFHSIQFGYFLVFKLEGKSLFCVLIFDKTATEIEYPFKNATIDVDHEELKVPKMKENENDDVSIGILDDFPCSQTRKEKRVKTKNDDKFQHLHSQSYSIADRVKLKCEEKKPDHLCENGKAKEEEEEAENEEEEEEDKDDELDETFVRKLRPQRQGKNHRKRKRKSEAGFNRIRKPLPPPPKENQKVVKIAINRWSAERFKLAEQNLLNVMKAKGAVFGNPIVRLELRQEARKLIRDTGLLDHLLKQMAGKVAPGGVDRFRRRHNPEGVNEYWLESADLVRIRREAGVQDPYWTPPLGWKPGDTDNPSQDPIFAKEMKGIKEEMTQMKRDMEELKSKSWQQEIMFMELVKKNDELGEQVMKMSHD